MKTVLATLIVIIFSIGLSAKDFKQTEDIINSILSESREELTEESESKQDLSADTTTDQGGREKESAAEETAPSTTTEEEILLKSGIDFYNSGLYDHALKKFLELSSKYPQSLFRDSTRVWMGKIYLRQYKYNEAIKEFSSIPADSGEYPAALYNIAEGYMLKGDSLSSIENYQRLASQFPDHELADNAMLMSGKLFLDMNKGTQALESTVRLIKYYRSRETIDDAYYFLGSIYEKDPRLKDIETARKIYKIFLKKSESGEDHFSRSPLIKRVRENLFRLEKNYFKLEQ